MNLGLQAVMTLWTSLFMEIINNRYFPLIKGETYNLIWFTVFCFVWLYSSANIAAGSLVGVDKEFV